MNFLLKLTEGVSMPQGKAFVIFNLSSITLGSLKSLPQTGDLLGIEDNLKAF